MRYLVFALQITMPAAFGFIGSWVSYHGPTMGSPGGPFGPIGLGARVLWGHIRPFGPIGSLVPWALGPGSVELE